MWRNSSSTRSEFDRPRTEDPEHDNGKYSTLYHNCLYILYVKLIQINVQTNQDIGNGPVNSTELRCERSDTKMNMKTTTKQKQAQQEEYKVINKPLWDEYVKIWNKY